MRQARSTSSGVKSSDDVRRRFGNRPGDLCDPGGRRAGRLWRLTWVRRRELNKSCTKYGKSDDRKFEPERRARGRRRRYGALVKKAAMPVRMTAVRRALLRIGVMGCGRCGADDAAREPIGRRRCKGWRAGKNQTDRKDNHAAGVKPAGAKLFEAAIEPGHKDLRSLGASSFWMRATSTLF